MYKLCHHSHWQTKLDKTKTSPLGSPQRSQNVGHKFHFFPVLRKEPEIRSRWASQVAQLVKLPPANAGDGTDSGSIPGSGRFFEGGNGNPLQYSCLENPKDRGAWQDAIHRVTKSRTQLNDWARHIFFITPHFTGWQEGLGQANSKQANFVAVFSFVYVFICVLEPLN